MLLHKYQMILMQLLPCQKLNDYLLLLFDYKRSYKNPMIDIVIPIAGIIVIVLIFFEGGYEVLKQYLINLIKASEESKQEPVEKAIQAVKYIKDIIAKK